MSKRKGFEPWKVEIVYRSQDGICANDKCSRPLAGGFHRHHKDSDPSNDDIANLQLFCPRFHGGQQYETLMEKKGEFLTHTTDFLEMAKIGKLSGSLADQLKDLIKLGLSLSWQLYGDEIEKAPAAIRINEQLLTSGILLKEYGNGYREGLNANVAALVAEMLKPYLNQVNIMRENKLLKELLVTKGKPVSGKKKSTS